MIDYKSITGDEKKVLDVILDELAKPIAEETNIPISEARESIISLIEKEFVKIVYKKNNKGFRFSLIPCIPGGLK